ncbi:MAG: carbohydrate ABC transporter permease [Ruminococcaceae bacterium]|nr:carbohydrate ABC transporter permease [Oscillospiraceae bacterium]
MNAQNIDNRPKELKNNKRKIRVEFERAPLKERLKAKFLSMYFVKKVVWYIFRLVLLIGVSYIVLFPFFSKIAGSFMLPDDFVDATVRLIPKKFSTDTYSAIWKENSYFEAFSNTLFLSATCAIIQTFICCFVAYGLAKFKFKGRGLVFIAVIFTLAIPHKTLEFSMFSKFIDFDVLGIFKFLNGGGWEIFGKTIIKESPDIIPSAASGFWSKIHEGGGISMRNTYWPFVILSLGGLAFKNGLYIFMLRQFFKGVPDELEESAYIDGSGIMRTFFTIILPLSIPMLITVFLFSFSWQWTDTFYTGLFVPDSSRKEGLMLLKDVATIPGTLEAQYSTHEGYNMFSTAVKNTAGIMIIAPLVVMYLFCQRYLVQGIERSGLTAD